MIVTIFMLVFSVKAYPQNSDVYTLIDPIPDSITDEIHVASSGWIDFTGNGFASVFYIKYFVGEDMSNPGNNDRYNIMILSDGNIVYNYRWESFADGAGAFGVYEY